jgi:hypothetical protein
VSHPTGCRCRNFECRRALALAAVVTAEPSLAAAEVEAGFDATITTGAAMRYLTAALDDDPDVLHIGAPAVVGRLVTELVARGSTTFTLPVCVRCHRTGRELIRTTDGGMCPNCRRRQTALACVRCDGVKPVAGRDPDGSPLCARCAPRPERRCGICGQTRPIARRAHEGHPDVCVNCFKLPTASCSRCHQRRPCSFASTPTPVCIRCAPRRTAPCAHCGLHRPPTAHWPEGPVCVGCYDAALSRRGVCDTCHTLRRLVDPPGPHATICTDCAGGTPIGHVCRDCGIEDRLYEHSRCNRCALTRRVTVLLADDTGTIPEQLAPLAAAISAAPNPRSALNWLRTGTAAAILTDIVNGRLVLSHDTLDDHPHPRAADYLRQMLLIHGLLPERNEHLERIRRFIDDTLNQIDRPTDRRTIQAYATWRVLRKLRRRAETNPGPRTATAHVRTQIKAAVRLLDWLGQQPTTLAEVTQADIDAWLATGPGAYYARDFILWATQTGRCRPLNIPAATANPGTTTDPDTRWNIIFRLLHDDTLELTDRVAGCLVLLYAQPLSRITLITRDQIDHHDDGTLTLRFGTDPATIPEPLAGLIRDLLDTVHPYTGIGSPAHTPWLFPGLQPGQPLSAARLGVRLGKLGIDGRASRRAALIHLAAEVPAAVLAELLGYSNQAAVSWTRDAGGNWSRYAADLAHDRAHTPVE